MKSLRSMMVPIQALGRLKMKTLSFKIGFNRLIPPATAFQRLLNPSIPRSSIGSSIDLPKHDAFPLLSLPALLPNPFVLSHIRTSSRPSLNSFRTRLLLPSPLAHLPLCHVPRSPRTFPHPSLSPLPKSISNRPSPPPRFSDNLPW